MRHQVVGFVEQLEAGPGRAPRVRRAGRQGGDQAAERLDHLHHQRHRCVRQDLELGVGLGGVREEPPEQLEQDLVVDVEQVGDPRGQRVGDHGHRVGPVVRADVRGHHRPGRLESRVGLPHLLVLVQDRDELAEVRVAPVPLRALALLHDFLDRRAGAVQPGDRQEVGPAEQRRGGLHP